jgi:uncharacterized membrane protein
MTTEGEPRGLSSRLLGWFRPGDREEVADDELGRERIIFFSDAVFAIAITLLALEIRLPEDAVSAEIGTAMVAIWGKYLSFLISFLTIGGFWIGHHRKFRHIERYNMRFMWLNLLALLCITFLPYPTALVGSYGDQPAPVVFYALWINVTALAFWALWQYAVRRGLVSAGLDPAVIRRESRRSLTPIPIFLLSIPIAFIQPYAAEALWVVVVLAPWL